MAVKYERVSPARKGVTHAKKSVVHTQVTASINHSFNQSVIFNQRRNEFNEGTE
jgi:hypothetical protein